MKKAVVILCAAVLSAAAVSAAIAGCAGDGDFTEKTFVADAAANVRAVSDADMLRRVVLAIVPFIGYPRSLNALACIPE